jgi:nitric oxide reductase large subunit
MGSWIGGIAFRAIAAIICLVCLVAVVWLALWYFIPAPPTPTATVTSSRAIM